MQHFKVVSISKDAAMNSPRHQYFNDKGISAYSCLIPQTHDTAHIVHFVSGADGQEYGQFDDDKKARQCAIEAVRAQRIKPDDSPSP